VPTDKKHVLSAAEGSTGQRLDGTGLCYYNARYYDPTIGRFISPDTVVPSPADPQCFNRYSYCSNNPLKYIDPTGLTDVTVTQQPYTPDQVAYLLLIGIDWDTEYTIESTDGTTITVNGNSKNNNVSNNGALPAEVYIIANLMRIKEGDSDLNILMPYKDEKGTINFKYHYEYGKGKYNPSIAEEYMSNGHSWDLYYKSQSPGITSWSDVGRLIVGDAAEALGLFITAIGIGCCIVSFGANPVVSIEWSTVITSFGIYLFGDGIYILTNGDVEIINPVP
jgi:RHS repeat-associated protein